MSIKRCEGVYDPDDDSYLLMNIDEIKGDILEIGSGTGIISIHYAEKGGNVTATDISEDAVKCTYLNAKYNSVKINVIRNNLFDGIKGIFDFCIFNPPYLPDGFPDDRSWSGGVKGNEIIDKFINEGKEHCSVMYYIESSFAPIQKERYNSLKFYTVKTIIYEFEQISLVRVENAKYR